MPRKPKDAGPIDVADDPALTEAIAKAPMRADPPPMDDEDEEPVQRYVPVDIMAEGYIDIRVDWNRIPMDRAQLAYQRVKEEFEKAGRTLNARLMAEKDSYTCFMCKKEFSGRPGMTDYSYQDPENGLFPRIDLCGEVCVVRWHQFRIDQRRDRFVKEAEEQRQA